MDGPILQVIKTIKLIDTSTGHLLANNVQNSIQEMRLQELKQVF
jgi:hypothetical protein